MTRDDRFYAFIVARTSRSRAHIRRISVHKRWLRASAAGLFVVLCGLMYGFYGLTQQAIAAAKKIKFVPAMKGGKPVSMWMQLVYEFLLGI